MTLPSHLFVSSVDGALYDTRDPDWSKRPPVRARYTAGRQPFQDLQDVKAALRRGPWTDLGSYPLYFVTRDGAALSFDAAREQFAQVARDFLNDASTGWRIEGDEINYEDGALTCDHTGKFIPAAYAAEGEGPESADD
jgi:hypothetical protein